MASMNTEVLQCYLLHREMIHIHGEPFSIIPKYRNISLSYHNTEMFHIQIFLCHTISTVMFHTGTFLYHIIMGLHKRYASIWDCSLSYHNTEIEHFYFIQKRTFLYQTLTKHFSLPCHDTFIERYELFSIIQ